MADELNQYLPSASMASFVQIAEHLQQPSAYVVSALELQYYPWKAIECIKFQPISLKCQNAHHVAMIAINVRDVIAGLPNNQHVPHLNCEKALTSWKSGWTL